MKNLILIVLLMTMMFAVGCSERRARYSVRKAFASNVQIEQVPGHTYEYLVFDKTNIYYIFKTDGCSTLPDEVVPMFGSEPIRKEK